VEGHQDDPGTGALASREEAESTPLVQCGEELALGDLMSSFLIT